MSEPVQSCSAGRAVEGELDIIVQLIHEHVGVDVGSDLTGVETAAREILTALETPFCARCGSVDTCDAAQAVGMREQIEAADELYAAFTGRGPFTDGQVEALVNYAKISNRMHAIQPPAAPVETKPSVREYIANYRFEMDGGGSYFPTEHEEVMLEDAIEGYLACCGEIARPTAEPVAVRVARPASHFQSSAVTGVPVAWIAFADNGNVRFWTSEPQRAEAEKQRGLDLRAFTLAELIALVSRIPAAPQTVPDREKVARVIHDGLGGDGWAYTNYGGDEWNDKRADLLNAADAVLALMPSQPQNAKSGLANRATDKPSTEVIGPFNGEMPSSLNDACRRLDLAQERIAQLEALVEPRTVRCPCGLREMGSCPSCRKPPQQSQQVKVPDGYTKLPAGVICKCFKMWEDGNGDHWCCTPPLSRPK